MNLLTNGAPSSVEVEGVEYEIRTDYRIGLQFERLMESAMPPDEIISRALVLYYPAIPDDLEAACERLVWFYRCGRAANAREPKPVSPVRKVLSFEHDASLIFAAFMGDYGIDLEAAELHWWKFRALLDGLKSGNRIVEIMGYRAADLSKLKGEERQRMQRLQRAHALPTSEEAQQRIDAVTEALMNGGKL